MKFVFYKRDFGWPLRQGAAVHSGNLMKQLASRGHQVKLRTKSEIAKPALDWLTGVDCSRLSLGNQTPPKLDWWSRRFCRFWGEDENVISALAEFVDLEKPDAVVGVGPEVLPVLAACGSATRIWYSADDPVLHQFSLGGLKTLKTAGIMAVYQKTMGRFADSTWVVSETDRKWSRRFGRGRVDWLPNGVDLDYFRPQVCEVAEKSCIFWGNLGFQPNADAVRYLLERIWPQVIAIESDAQLWICGCQPSDELRERMSATKGVQFFEDLPDLRERICRAQIAVFPLISGAGVKNKLLEAAALEKPIVATPRCKYGLMGDDIPIRICDRPEDWAQALFQLWGQSEQRHQMGRDARQWIEDWHHWGRTAKIAEDVVEQINQQA